VASSKAHRLKPDAIDIRVEVNPVHWCRETEAVLRTGRYQGASQPVRLGARPSSLSPAL
jgi:hypothetical protein